MSTFVDPDDGNGSPLSRSSGGSNSTANSNTNSNSSGSCSSSVASPTSGVSSRQGGGIAHKDFAVSEHDADATTTTSSKLRF